MLFCTVHLIVLARPAITITSGEHYSCVLTVVLQSGHCMPSLKQLGNKGKSAPQLMTQQEGVSWPDESHSLEEPFIDQAITETLYQPVLPPHYAAGKHSESFSLFIFPFLLCTFFVCLFCHRFDGW